jgi:hypothetical protein
MKQPLLLTIFSTILFSHVMGLGFGCSGCLNQSLDLVREGCYSKCGSAFTSASSEYQACRIGCNDFIFNQKCCQTTCTSDINSCLISPLKAAPSGISQMKRDVVLIPPRHAKREKRTATPKSPVTILRRQMDVGKICCQFFGSIYLAGGLNVANSLVTHNFSENEIAGLALIAFGVAGTSACSKVYEISCFPVKLILQQPSLFPQPAIPQPATPPPPAAVPGRARRSWTEWEDMTKISPVIG